MRRQPDREHYNVEATEQPPLRRTEEKGLANMRGDEIRPFLVSGGSSYYLVSNGPPAFNPLTHGVQLITSLYVPNGTVGFVKQLRVGPYMPAQLSDPWLTSGIAGNQASWRKQNRATGLGDFDVPQAGDIWRTPFGWENIFTDDTEQLPTWRWSLRAMQGDIVKLRNQGQNIPPFNVLDPASWYLVPNIAVPGSAYSGGIPGDSVGADFSAQRMQCIPGDELETHIMIPQDTTLMLFAEWRQEFGAYGTGVVGASDEYVQYSNDEFVPILPSYGQLHGYMQALTSENSARNATQGWGG